MTDGCPPNERGARAPYSSLRRAIAPGWIALLLCLLAAVPLWQSQALTPEIDPAPGDPLPRIQCPPGYTAHVYAQGLRSPDGLAFHTDGTLYVAEESAGQVSRVDPAGNVTPVWTGLDHPEGIAFDEAGNLYVVEDIPAGRLLRMDARGSIATLATGLEAPEGVAWVQGDALYVTESSLQFSDSLADWRSRIARVSPSGEVTRFFVHRPTIDGSNVTFWSYAGIAAGSDGRLYVTNELSGVEITQTVVLIPGLLTTTLTLSSTESVLAVDPQAGTGAPLVNGLTTPEGPRFSLSGGSSPRGFPLYVAEEDIGGGQGRLSVAGPDGQHTALCTGFGTIEDVAIDAQGRLYVSEDQTGLIVRITPARTPPGAVEISGPGTTRIDRGTFLVAAVRPLTTTMPITWTWRATGDAAGSASVTVGPGLSATAVLTWGVPGPQWVTVTASNAGGAMTGTHALTVMGDLYLPLIVRPFPEAGL